MDGSSAREPGISAAGQESESKLRFGADGGENGRKKDSGRYMWVKDHLV